MTVDLQTQNPFLLFIGVLLAVALFALVFHAALDGLRDVARTHNLKRAARRSARKTVDYLAEPAHPSRARSDCPNCDTPTSKMIQGPRAPGAQNLCCAGCGAVYEADLNTTRVSADRCIGYALVDADRRVTPRRTPTRTHPRWHDAPAAG
ncbi:hypothetical protein CKO28_02880 [Rhodovibrio sodomensis]|uniref:GATA-type domain-containing protein n=1 Tax=Rhodovibrio sodomensis TaxID=1088 RepID=A0ABS1D994_9PROT|nr:hypothetical protein [Rhodovibrio sodomensis]MBK1666987.1 hypothetical protein [Rhodovibrio sodomensis]